MKAIIAIGIFACGLIFTSTPHAYGETQPPVSVAQLDAFMKKWATYEPFKVPRDSKDESLLLAALEKDPQGPWAAYVSMKFAQTKSEARELAETGRATRYKASLDYLKPARDILTNAVEADPDNEQLQHSLNQIQYHITLASLESGFDLVAIKSEAESALVNNTDKKSWNYGNIVYNQHALLGRIALREGKLNEARKQLLAAGHTPGSPQLNSFGPDFILARELAEKGEFDTVIEFLDLVARFWANPEERTRDLSIRNAKEHRELLEAWKKELRAGNVPDHRKWR